MFEFTSEELSAIALSLQVASIATLCALPLAILAGYALARWSFPGKTLLNGALHLPLVLPPVVTGYLLLILFGKQGPAGQFFENVFGITFSFRWTGAALAAGVMGFPLMLRAVRLSFESLDRRLEAAAGTLGASPMWTFLLVSLPLALPGVIAGAVLCFAKALGEFGATITFVSNIPGQSQTIPILIHTYTQVPDSDAGLMRLSIVAFMIAMLALLISEWLSRRALQRASVFT